MATDPTILYRAVQLLVAQGLGPEDVAKRLNDEHKLRLTRQSIYPLLAEAYTKGFILLNPPRESAVEKALAALVTPEVAAGIHVIDVRDATIGGGVPARAALRAVELIAEVKRSIGSRSVGVGVGPGGATREFCIQLSHHLTRAVTAGAVEPIRLFSISAGCLASRPEYASTSFFHLFDPSISVNPMGLFAPTVVEVNRYKNALSQPGAAEAYNHKREIDIIMSSLGGFDAHEHDHDILKEFLVGEIGEDWVGNVQYRPYTKSGAVRETTGKRAVTLFEIEDFVNLATQRNRHVLLVARRCPELNCKWTKAKALIPLLTEPSLKVWSELFLDVPTAKKVIELLPRKIPPPAP